MKCYVNVVMRMRGETIEHLFIKCPIANRLRGKFAAAGGINGPFLQLRDSVMKWLNAERPPKLQILFNAVPLFILWKIWKRRNTANHEGRMTYVACGYGNRNKQKFVSVSQV